MNRRGASEDAAPQLSLPLVDAPHTATNTRTGMRLARIGGRIVEYELRRSRRRTIGFLVDGSGLRVTAPRWVSQGEIESALRERGEWILRKIVEWREFAARRARYEIRWEHGARVPFLGEQLEIAIDPGHAGPVARSGERLLVGLPPDAEPSRVRDSVQSWLQQQARALYGQRLAHFEARFGVAPKRWSLSSARTRWGSCGADGAIRLNWRLVHFPLDIVDYVICHELAHLRELNHGPGFWNAVADLFPDYARARQWLKSCQDRIGSD